MTFERLRLSTQLLILIAGTVLLTISLLIMIAVIQAHGMVQHEATERVTVLASITSDQLAPALASGDRSGIERTLAATIRDNALSMVVVFDAAGGLITRQPQSATPINEAELATFGGNALRAQRPLARIKDSSLSAAAPITMNQQTLGVIVAHAPAANIGDKITRGIPRMLTAGLGVALLGGLLAMAIANYLTAPLHALATAATAVGRGQLEVNPKFQRGGEVGALVNAFKQMVTDLRAAQAETAEHQARVAERTAELECTLLELRASTNDREQLSATVRALSSPVLPVLDGVLVMPLIGMIDAERATFFVESLLEAIESQHTQIAIIDVTGVPVVDTQVARSLIAAADTAKLLGTQVVLAGLRPELAQTIVGLGLNLSHLVIRADLQSSISYALQQRTVARPQRMQRR